MADSATAASKSIEIAALADHALRARSTRWVRMHKQSVFLAALTAFALALASLVVVGLMGARGEADRPRLEVENGLDPEIENDPDPEIEARTRLAQAIRDFQSLEVDPERADERNIQRGIDIGRSILDSPSFGSLSALEKGRIRFKLANFLNLSRDRAGSREMYRMALEDLERADGEGAASPEDLILKATAQSRIGQYEESNRTLDRYRALTQDPEKLTQCAMMTAWNLVNIGIERYNNLEESFQRVKESSVGYETQPAPGSPQAAALEELREALAAAGEPFTHARAVLDRYASDKNNPLVHLQANKSLLDTYLLELALVSVRMRMVMLGERPRPMLIHQFNSLTNLRRRLIREAEDFANRPGVKDTALSFIEHFRDSEREEGLNQFQCAAEFLFTRILLEEVKVFYIASYERTGDLSRQTDEIHQELLEILGRATSRIQPFSRASQIILADTEDEIQHLVQDSPNDLIRGLNYVAKALQRHRGALPGFEFVDGGFDFRMGQERVRLISAESEHAAELLGDESVYGQLARILAADGRRAGGQSLGKEAATVARVVFRHFKEPLLAQLIKQRWDFHSRHKRKMMVLLVSPEDEKAAKDWVQRYPELWKDYGIRLLFDWPGRIPLSDMSGDQEKSLLKSSEWFLRSHFPRGINPDQVLFIVDNPLALLKRSLASLSDNRLAAKRILTAA